MLSIIGLALTSTASRDAADIELCVQCDSVQRQNVDLIVDKVRESPSAETDFVEAGRKWTHQVVALVVGFLFKLHASLLVTCYDNDIRNYRTGLVRNCASKIACLAGMNGNLVCRISWRRILSTLKRTNARERCEDKVIRRIVFAVFAETVKFDDV